MADKSIGELVAASQVGSTDLFVLQQAGTAKKLTGQILENWLVALADGHGGIQSVSKTGTSGLVDTYSITYADLTTSTFTVTNGKAISSVQDKWAVSSSNSTAPSTWYNSMQTMTVSNRYLWHYQIMTYNDGTTSNTTKTVVGVYGDTGQAWYMHIKYSAVEPTQDADMGDIPDNWIGVYSGTSASAPTHYTSYDWFKYKGEIGLTGNGISTVAKTGTSGLVDTYTITFTSGNTTTFELTNGSSIQSIAKTSTSGLVDTYTVTQTNGNVSTFTVTNAKSITSITQTSGSHTPGTFDVYTINFNDGDTSQFQVYNGTNGTGSVSTVDGINAINQNVPLLLWDNGAPTTTTAGVLKQRYFDLSSGMLYICTAINDTTNPVTYTWVGTGVLIDSSMSSTSENPVQNKVIYSALSSKQNSNDNSLNTTSKTIVGAINENYSRIVEKSTVSVSATGTATDEISYITVDGVEKKISGSVTPPLRYGFKREKAESSPTARITYLYDAVNATPAHMDFTNNVFSWGTWKDFIEEIARPVMLKYDGTVDYELDHDDQTKKLDGTASDIADTTYEGNAMVEFGKAFRWVKRWEDADYEYVVFSNKRINSDYHAYAHTGSDGQVKDAFYWGMFTGLNVSSKLRSIGSGAPMVSETRETEITYAKANGAGWHTINFSGWCYINDLLTLISKSDNSQASFGEGIVGASAKSDNGTLKDKGCFYGSSSNTIAVKVLWIENHWGNLWQGMAGLVLDGANGFKVKPYAPYCDTPVSAADWSAYTSVSVVPGGTRGGYVSAELNSEYGYIPKTASGSATTYMCDGLWFNNSQVDYPLVGGSWSNGAACGSRYLTADVAPSGAVGSIGSRPAYIP